MRDGAHLRLAERLIGCVYQGPREIAPASCGGRNGRAHPVCLSRWHHAAAVIRSSSEEPSHPEAEVRLRSLVWSLHARPGDGHHQYGDDGELQCSGIDGPCDFLRQPVVDLDAHIFRRGRRLLEELAEQCGHCAAGAPLRPVTGVDRYHVIEIRKDLKPVEYSYALCTRPLS